MGTTSTINGFQPLQNEQFNAALQEWLEPFLVKLLDERAPGHCMRVSDLEREQVVPLVRRLQIVRPEMQIYMLRDEHDEAIEGLNITSTKVVELRNPHADQSLRPPLLLFIPPNLRTSAEDSFGIATFEEVAIAHSYEGVWEAALRELPPSLKSYVIHLIGVLQEKGERQSWAWWGVDVVARIRYILTVLHNKPDMESIGASLYEVGLIPDFDLPADWIQGEGRIRKNLKVVRGLTLENQDVSPRRRVVDLEVSNRDILDPLMQLILREGIDQVKQWARAIATEKAYYRLSFNKWQFADETALQTVTIRVTDLEMQLVTAELEKHNARLDGLVDQPYLNPQSHRKFGITFEVTPHPSQILNLSHFTLQIFMREGGTGNIEAPVGITKNEKGWKAKRSYTKVTFDKLNRAEFMEGWHFVRVSAWSHDGRLLSPPPPQDDHARAAMPSNESEPFYVVLDASEPEQEPPQRALPIDASVEHGWLRLQFSSVNEKGGTTAVQPPTLTWATQKPHAQLTPHRQLVLGFGRYGRAQVVVPRHLYTIERVMLTSPRTLAVWHWPIIRGGLEAGPTSTTRDLRLPQLASVRSFLEAREQYFNHVSGDGEFVTQAVRFSDQVTGEKAIAYIEAYNDLLKDLRQQIEHDGGSTQQHALQDLRTLLQLDMVRFTLRDHGNTVNHAILLTPLHPLQVAWYLTWAQVAQSVISDMREGQVVEGSDVRDHLLHGLTAFNFPSSLVTPEGYDFTSVAQLHPFWTLYARADVVDPRGLAGRLCVALGLPDPIIGGSALDSNALVTRVRRYLAQHPYIRTLTLNLFNPGRATMIAELLTKVIEDNLLQDLAFDVRLFVQDPEEPTVGESLYALLNPSRLATKAGAELFARSTGNHLFPKLRVAIRDHQSFEENPAAYQAHIAMLFDMFPAMATVGAALPIVTPERAALYGLVQEFAVAYQDGPEIGAVWRYQAQHGKPLMLPEWSSALLTDSATLYAGAVATVAKGQPAFEQRPVVILSLKPQQRQLIHQVHDSADWVFTFDRHFGIEFFDHRGTQRNVHEPSRPDFIIDYSVTGTTTDSYHLLVTTRSVTELEAFIAPILREYQLPASNGIISGLLTRLRALSGRITLKLLSGYSSQAEALGLSLAYLFIEHEQWLTHYLIVPLDDHLEWFRQRKEGQEPTLIEDGLIMRRTDLALFRIDPAERQLECHLIEVKNYRHDFGLGDWNALKGHIGEQLKQSEKQLRRRFAPPAALQSAERLLRSHELTTLLEFYLERALRYDLVTPEMAQNARHFMASFEQAGYDISFRHHGIIFDLNKAGIEQSYEDEVTFYRIGQDYIRGLIDPLDQDGKTDEATSDRLFGPLFPDSPLTHITPRPLQQADVGDRRVEDRTSPIREPAALPPIEATEFAVLVEDGQVALPPDNSRTEEPVVAPAVAIRANEDGRAQGRLADAPDYDIILGAGGDSPQYGILGQIAGRKVALDLNHPHTISLFGVQGGGKSYTLGSIIEMACEPLPGLNQLPRPLGVVMFHYSTTTEYKPEATSMVYPNSVAEQVATLRTQYGADPQRLKDVILLTPRGKVRERQAEFPDINVLPLVFAPKELKVGHWKFLMGAVGNQSMYIRQINLLMRNLREALTLDALIAGIESSPLSDMSKDIALTRLKFAADYIDERQPISTLLQPGRLVIIDLRDEYIETDEALGLFVVLLEIFAEATYEGELFNKLVVFDEAHKYIQNPDLVSGLVTSVREMRHKGTSILVASQEPRSVPVALIELSTHIIMHRFNSPEWLKHIQKANVALGGLTAEKMGGLKAGEAYVWAARASDDHFTKSTARILCRPRASQHGGATRTAVSE